MEAWHYTALIVLGYALAILVIGTGRWTKMTHVAIDDYFKVAPGFGFLILYLGFAGIIVAGGLAAGMSSLDADTNANSAMLTKDVYGGFIKKKASDRHYILVGRLFVAGLVSLTVVLAMKDWGLITLMIGVTASMITQLLPAVIAVTVPMRLRFTKSGVTCGIIAGLVVSLGTRFFPVLGFDPAFWGLVVNVPVALLVSRSTLPPDPRAVARIRDALDAEFRSGIVD